MLAWPHLAVGVASCGLVSLVNDDTADPGTGAGTTGQVVSNDLDRATLVSLHTHITRHATTHTTHYRLVPLHCHSHTSDGCINFQQVWNYQILVI